ncbi:uncharacterized protein ACBT44_015639 isoform 3-T4 [Syngnathus typhle]
MMTLPTVRQALVLSCVLWMLYTCTAGLIDPKTCDTVHGWTAHGSHCYKKMETTNGWLGARYDCLLERADLVSITTEDEEIFVKEQMGDKPFWIGLSNLKCNGDWCDSSGEEKLTWSDTAATSTHANWDSRQKGSANVESCAYVNQGVRSTNQPGKWRHGSCRSSLAYMCKRSASDCPDGRPCSFKDFGYSYSRVETSFCDSGEFLYKDSCYHFEGTRKIWKAAEDFCKDKGGHLASVHSHGDRQFLTDHRRQEDPEAWYSWLGLKGNNGKLEWSDGSATDDVPSSLSTSSDVCSILNDVGIIEMVHCSDSGIRPSICQKGKARHSLSVLLAPTSASGSIKTCDARIGWTLHGSHCYKKMETPNGWLGARYDCLWEGGDLVSVTSKDEEDFVKEQMGDKPFWIGLSNLNCDEDVCEFLEAGEKKLTWSDTAVTPTYANWDSHQDGSANVGSCAYINQGVHLSSQPGKWRYGSCQSSLAYMCKWSPDDCPDGWPCSYKDLGYGYRQVETSFCDSGEFLYKDSCYHFEGTQTNQEAAENLCKNKGGHLASVHSLVDGQFLAAHRALGWYSWLGLKENNGKLEWSDGSATDDVPLYLPTQPYTCSKLTSDGEVYMDTCETLRPSICQKGKARDSLPLLPAPTSASGKSAKCGWWQENPANDSFCYLINSKPSKTWKEARDKCARLSGNLLGITDSQEHAFIQGLVPKASSLWLDTDDTTVEDGSEQSAQSSPNSVQLAAAGDSSNPSGRRCNFLSGEGGGEVGDCKTKRGYVCKRRVIQTCDRTKGWRRSGSKCYKKMATTNGWLGARYDCVLEGGDLVSITSPYEEIFVKKQMGDKPFWIGRSNLKCNEAWCQLSEAGEKRLTGSDDTAVTPTYANWDSRQDRSADVGSCAYVNQGAHGGTQPGKWRHGSCASSLAYMCERPLDACPEGRLCSYKDYGLGYHRVDTSYCDNGDFLYKDSCYHFEGMVRPWAGAERFCQEWNGHLTSVLSWEERQFLAAHAPYVEGLQSWVGLKKNKGNFEWSDSTPAGNTEWVPNGPIGRGNCAALSQTGKLEDWPCTKNQPFICKKAKVQDFLHFLPPPGRSAKCGWWQERTSSDFCYLIQRRPTKVWKEARDDCRRRGGDLLSITDSQEQDFIQSLYASLPSAPSLWLGVNNNIMKDGSKWTDGSFFGYIHMNADDPGDLSGASCLSLRTSNDRWKFDDCRKRKGYVCKKRGNVPTPSQQPHDGLINPKATCDAVNGWSAHGSNCYKKMETPNGWLGARHNCLWEGADLVSITSQDEEIFVKEQMGNKPFWIGLSNLNCDEDVCEFLEAGEKKLTWSDTAVTPTYANWDSRQDGSADVGSCAYVNQGVHLSGQPGKWRHGSCQSSLVYMCERSPDDCPDGWPCSFRDLGYSYRRVETSFCDSGEFSYKDSCYHFEGTGKTWQAAEDSCKNKGGHLASLHSLVDGQFLAAHEREGFHSWVGLENSTAQLEERNGSSTDNATWSLTQDSDECPQMNGKEEVETQVCTGLCPSICQKGKARDSLPLLPAPLTSASGKSAKCGWWQENPANDDFCYLINSKPTETWKEARDKCARLRGNLLGISDSQDHTFVQGLLPNASSSVWLDASDIMGEDGSKKSDHSSPSSAQLAAAGNPGDPSGRRCNSLLGGKGGREVGDCEEKRGYVCKRRVIQTCERNKGWRRLGPNCYKKMATANGWLGARYDCVLEGGDLASITSPNEEIFVKEQMGDKPFWIGRSNLKCNQAWCQFFEAGEKSLSLFDDTAATPTYANWDSRQGRIAEVGSCAYVNQGAHGGNQPGKWRHGSCGSSLAYMCERPLDACPEGRLCSYKDYGLGYHRVETSYCDNGDFLYKDSCYHFEGRESTWKEAEDFCQEWNGHLTSVLSWDERQFLAAHAPYVEGLQSWVGLKKNKGNFEWSDSTPANNIEWVPDGPAGRGDCCVLSLTGQLEDWPCTNIRLFICKKAKVQDFPLPPPPGWSAKCGWWQDRPSSDFCYLIQRRLTKAWKEARDDCLRRGGDLLSITDSHEQAFIQITSKAMYTALPSAPSLWLGVNNNITKGGSEWTDGSPFGYILMDGDEPGDLSGASCLSFLTSNSRWKFDDCRKKRGYVCKKRGNTAKPPRPHDGFKETLVCNDRSADLVCEAEGQKQGRISIQSAFYGRRSWDVCLADGDSYNDEYCTVEGILPRYRKMCNSQQKCHIELMEDESCPASSSKYLQMVYSCEQKVCLDSLGIADGSVADSSFMASSSMEDATPEKARLNGESCWKPSKGSIGSWIQVNLGYTRKVTGIVTQGCDGANTGSWNIHLEMKLSVNWRKWTEHPNGKFIGGGTHLLETPAFAQYVRILPLENLPQFGLRFDILGCAHDDETTCARTFNSLHVTDSMTFYCPPGCDKEEHFVFGLMVYSAGSHVCAAAIHAGVIRSDIGGNCIVMRAPKQQVYTGSTGNGITSRHLVDPLDVSHTFGDGEPRCSAPDWEEFAGFCYKTFEGKKKWDDAQLVCRSLGADLVSIHSEVEQASVKNVSNLETSDMWTGMNDLALPGTLVWSDRHEVTFTHWAAGEPSQRVGLGKHCVAVLRQTGRWKLMSCAQANSFMCKMPTAHFPIASPTPTIPVVSVPKAVADPSPMFAPGKSPSSKPQAAGGETLQRRPPSKSAKKKKKKKQQQN